MTSIVDAPPAPPRSAATPPPPAWPSPPAGAPWPKLPPPQPPYADDPRFDGHEPPWHRSTAPTPPPFRPAAVPPVRRARWWPALAVAVVLLLLAGTAYAVASGMGPADDTATRRPTPTTTAPPTSSTPSTATPSKPKSTTPSTVPDPQTDPSTGTGGTGGSSGSNQTTVDWESVADQIKPGMVYIETRVSNGIGAGTGMILTADGTVLTNNHVIDGASSIVVTTAVDGKMFRATVVGADPAEDVAVIKLTNASGLTPIPIGDSSTVQVGDEVAGMGNAGGTGTSTTAPGHVVALDQQVTATDEQGGNAETIDGTIQVDATIVPGHSGGPLVSADAKVVGIDTAASANNLNGGGSTGGRGSRGGSSGSEGYAIPINHALQIAQQLEKTGKGADPSTASGAYLGVQITNGTSGAEVVGVATGGPAEQAGITAGSTITSIGGTPITSASALSSAVQGHRSGDRVSVGWTDADGQSHQATITLG